KIMKLKKYFFLLLFLFNYTVAQEQPFLNVTEYQIITLSYWNYLPDSNYTCEVIKNYSNRMTTIYLNDLKYHDDKIFWLIKEFHFEKDEHDLVLSFSNLSEKHEIYWDDILLSQNYDKEKEKFTDTKVRFEVSIDHKLTSSGNHLILIKLFDSTRNKLLDYSWIHLGLRSKINSISKNQVVEFSFYIGLFFTSFLLCISLFISGWKNHSFLFFGGYSSFYAFVSLWLLLIEHNFIEVKTFRIFEPFIQNGHSIALLFYIYFLLYFFEFGKKLLKLLPAISLIVLIISIESIFAISLLYLSYSILLGYSLLIVLSKQKEKKTGHYFLAFAIFVNFLFTVYSSLFIYLHIPIPLYFISNSIVNILFVSFNIIAISRKIQEQNKKYQETLLLSHKLEAALLKKSIQPHFIMNTLLSLKSILIKDIGKAEKMIDTLATQFQIINKILLKNEIDLTEELELCKSHLTLMGFRLNSNFKLVIEGNIESGKIPPLILHTLVENALTHSYNPQEDGNFKFTFEINGNETRLKLINDGSKIKDIKIKSPDEVHEGLGIKFVKTVLKDNYPGNWKMNYGVFENFWQVEIIINK
ncbi:MAG: histidine kinase, partial [Bacteroidetes bacterium]|nr:histidine kinase [Bacteroidota bacterium]